MIDHDAVHLALRNRALAYLPTSRAFENVAFTPVAGEAYCEEDYVPGTKTLLTANASSGVVEDTGLYVIRWYGLANIASHTIAASVDALLARFTPGTWLTAGSNAVRIRSDVAPTRGQLLATGDGWAVCTVTIPWRCYSTNAIAA